MSGKSSSNKKNRIAKNEFYQKWNRERDKEKERKEKGGKT